MSVAGFSIANGVAWAWADSESYNDANEPTGRDVVKIGVAGGQLIVCGVGWRTIVEKAATAAAHLEGGAASENLAKLMTLALQMSEWKRRYFAEEALPWSAMTTFGAVLIEGDRLRGFTMREADGFVPRPCDAWGSPGFAHAPTCAAAVEMVARGQLDIVRREVPRATGRALRIAKIGPRGVATTKIQLPAERR